nr:DUF2793 domain-containing protein [Acidobacteriota bacterium]
PPTADNHLTTRGWVNASVRDYVDSTVAAKIEARLEELDWQESVVTKNLTSPPSLSNTEADRGKRFLLFMRPRLGDWAGDDKDNNIAGWTGTTWEFSKPDPGTAVFVEDEGKLYVFMGGAWSPFLGAPPPLTAGAGLGQSANTLFVQPGDGVAITNDRVTVAFSTQLPPPVGAARVGQQTTAARGDHSHALPDHLGSSTGVVELKVDERNPLGKMGALVTPGLGPGLISVILGLEHTDALTGRTQIYVGAPELFAPPVRLGALISPGVAGSETAAETPTQFAITARLEQFETSSPLRTTTIKVRWYAYRVGQERVALPPPTGGPSLPSPPTEDSDTPRADDR